MARTLCPNTNAYGISYDNSLADLSPITYPHRLPDYSAITHPHHVPDYSLANADLQPHSQGYPLHDP